MATVAITINGSGDPLDVMKVTATINRSGEPLEVPTATISSPARVHPYRRHPRLQPQPALVEKVPAHALNGDGS